MTDERTTIETPTSSGMGVGMKVFLVLAALTVIEYAIAVTKPTGQITLIFIIALAKAALIVIYFMHIGALRKGGHE
jgi:caa(3)-type oxidase subunit IV